MLKAPIPQNEMQRHQDLLSYDILDTEEDEDYSALVELAAQICHCTSATISFIDRDWQWFKCRRNIPVSEGPRDISFCGHVIMHEEVMVINNASKDERFADNPDVTGGLKIGFYAGAPIISSSGHKLGTVCVIDNQPKVSINENQKRSLEIIASQVTKLLELRLKNKVIAEQTTSLLRAEKELMKLNVIKNEKENDRIAYELHENIAQIVAAAKMNVEAAEDLTKFAQTRGLLKDYLSVILNDVKTLSNSITPTTFTASDYKGYILDLARNTFEAKNIKVRFSENLQDIDLRDKTGLTVYRIFQYTLSLAELAGADFIYVSLEKKENSLSLLLEHNGKKDITEIEEARGLISNVITRAGIIDAVFESNSNFSRMQIVLPYDL